MPLTDTYHFIFNDLVDSPTSGGPPRPGYIRPLPRRSATSRTNACKSRSMGSPFRAQRCGLFRSARSPSDLDRVELRPRLVGALTSRRRSSKSATSRSCGSCTCAARSWASMNWTSPRASGGCTSRPAPGCRIYGAHPVLPRLPVHVADQPVHARSSQARSLQRGAHPRGRATPTSSPMPTRPIRAPGSASQSTASSGAGQPPTGSRTAPSGPRSTSTPG
jgi:hypothetical protein